MIYNIIYNIIFNLLLILTSWYYIYDFNICLLLISIDNISYGLDFLMNNINKNLTYKDIINVNNSLYKLQICERYIFYIFLICIYYFINIFITNDNIYYLKLLLSLLIIPTINNIIYDEYFDVFDKLKKYKEKIIKLIFCEQIYHIIKKLNIYYVDNKIDLDKKEIISVLMKLTNFKLEIITFIKNTLVVMLLNYFKSKSVVYYKLIKYIYIYNSGVYFINNINEKDATDKFIEIFKNKNYTKLNDPMTIHSMLFLYYNKNAETNWNILYDKINYNILTFLTLWTFGSFFDSIYKLIIIICISIFIRNTKKNINKLFNKKFILSLILLLLAYTMSENIIWLSFIHQFGYYIIHNIITRNIYNLYYNNIYTYMKNNYKNILSMLHENCISYVRNIIYTIILKYLFMYNLHYGYSFIIFITNTEKCINTKFLYGILYILIQNKNNLFKILLFSYICSLFINLIKKYEIIKQTIMLNNKLSDKLGDKKILYSTEDELKNELKDAMEDNIEGITDDKTDDNIG